jgi:Uma2 family endonuclease
MKVATLARHRWTSADYERMLAAGMFEKIELLCGDVVLTGVEVRPYRWTLDDYEQLITLGLLEGKHVEPIQGEILTMAAMGEPHALTIMQLNFALPALSSEPEPDIAIVTLSGPTNEASRPTNASLIIEVAESSLTYDRERKGPLYAAGIQEYWLVNLPECCLEVYRQPMPDAGSFSGWYYQGRQRLWEGDYVAPLEAPEVVIAVDALLPRR